MSTTSDHRCPHCGRELRRFTAEVNGRRIVTDCWEPCQCDGAVRERKDALSREKVIERDAAIAALVAKSGIPKRFESAEDPRAGMYAEKVLAGRNLYLTGGVGTGKTTLACAVGLELCRRGERVRFVSMLALLDGIKAGFKTADADPMPRYKQAPVLILDDLGKGAQTDWALERLFALIDHRSAEMLPTIATTQYQPAQLIARMASSKGDVETAKAIVSRLRQDCDGLELKGADRRAAR